MDVNMRLFHSVSWIFMYMKLIRERGVVEDFLTSCCRLLTEYFYVIQFVSSPLNAHAIITLYTNGYSEL